jgi:hypothetical protein
VLDHWVLRPWRAAAVHRTRKPIQNAHIESFNARLREECLNEHVFVSLDDARSKIEKWRVEYNRERPHSSLGNLTPEEFAAQAVNPRNSALARTARLAQELLANVVQTPMASDPKPNSSRSPSGRVKGEPRNLRYESGADHNRN